jgi:hypothetical protein
MRSRWISLAAACLALAACAAQDQWPREFVDPGTAVHATILAEPWVYAREVPMLAANARDYLNLGVVATNRSGDRTYWLGAVAWSTIDRTATGAGSTQPGRLRLVYAKDSIELTPVAGGRLAVGLDRPEFTGPGTRFTEDWYPLSIEQLRRLAESPPTAVDLLAADAQVLAFAKWRARRKPMIEFLKATGL